MIWIKQIRSQTTTQESRILCLLCIVVDIAQSAKVCKENPSVCLSKGKDLIHECHGQAPGNGVISQILQNSNYIMQNCNFSNFSAGEFFGAQPLHSLEINYNYNQTIPLELFLYNLPSLCRLSVSNSQTEGNFELSFENLTKLETLEMTGNDFTALPSTTFSNLAELLNLHIKNGNLTELPKDIFEGLTNLLYLNLESNKITEIKPKTFLYLKYLKWLVLNGNRIKRLKGVVFANLLNLVCLEIARNDLRSFPTLLFHNAPKINILNIGGNLKVKKFPSRFFDSVKELQHLNASSCNLSTIEESLFLRSNKSPLDGIKLLRILDLSHNQITKINQNAFRPLVGLNTLNLSHNPIIYLPKHLFVVNINLESLYLSNCKLTVFPDIDWTSVDFNKLDISYNHITDAVLPVFTKKHTQIILDYNRISNVQLYFENPTATYPTYSIVGNSLVCNCRLESFLKFLHSQLQTTQQLFTNESVYEKCQAPNSSRSLMDVFPDHLTCKKGECLSECECIDIQEEEIDLNCSYRNLTRSPPVLPPGVTIVRLQNNNIASLFIIHPSWYDVTHLYINENKLHRLDDWVIFPRLYELSLRGNLLEDLPSKLMSVIDSSPGFILHLSNNRWKCYCESIDLIIWIKKHERKIIDYGNLTCEFKEDNITINSLIRDIVIEDLCFDPSQSTTKPKSLSVFVIISVIVPIILFLLFACCYIYGQRHSILAVMYAYDMHCGLLEKPIVHDVMYDVFLCYSNEDHQLANDIVRRLEPEYQFCLHERDWNPENDVAKNILYSIQNSKVIIMLLSNNFVTSSWIQNDFLKVYSQISNLNSTIIPIHIDEAAFTFLPDVVRSALSFRTGLKLTERFFWEKLEFFLRSSE